MWASLDAGLTNCLVSFLSHFVDVIFPFIFQEPLVVDVDPAWSKKHEALEYPTKLGQKPNNKTGGSLVLNSDVQGDDPFAQVSGLMVDLDTRIERNDEGLLSAYANLYRFGENDQQTVSTIEALKAADDDIMRYILQVIFYTIVNISYLEC